MNPKWQKQKLRDVCKRVTVGHVGPMAKEYVDSGVPFLRSQNIQPFRLETTGIKYITPAFHEKLKKSSLRPGDVAIVRTGYPGTCCVIPEHLGECNCADLVIATMGEKLNPHFLAALLNSDWGKARVAGSLVGVAQQHFNVTVAKEFVLYLPPRNEQDKLVSILQNYIEFIENNLRRIKILEEMAQNLYREWFVKFRFPGHEKVKFVDSPLGEIPEGWEIKELQSLACIIDCSHARKPKQTNSDNILLHVWNIDSSGRLDLSKKYCISDSDYAAWSKRIEVTAGDCVITKTGRVGAVAQIPEGVKTALGRNLVAIRWSEHPDFLFQYLMSPSKSNEVQRLTARGTIMESLHVKAVEKLRIVLSPIPLITEYENQVSSMHSCIHIYIKQNRILRKTRDLLLPKLISGELDVSELDIEIPEVME